MDILNLEERYSMSMEDVVEMTFGKSLVVDVNGIDKISYEEFVRKGSMIILMMKRDNKGVGHYVCLNIRKKHFLDFYCSFGRNVYALEGYFGLTDCPLSVWIAGLLREYGFVYSYNSVQMESWNFCDCGCYSIVRSMLRELSNEEFNSFIERKVVLDSSDKVVSMMCSLCVLKNKIK